jgi:hypothetical protein
MRLQSLIKDWSVVHSSKNDNDPSQVIIMTQILTLSIKNTDLIMTYFTENNDLMFVEPCFLVLK